MKILMIPEPYWNAGREFGWDGQFSQIGIPIDIPYIKGEGYLHIQVQGRPDIWAVSKARARAIVLHYKAYRVINGVKHCVVPWAAFNKVV
jgi:hypothetical protein